MRLLDRKPSQGVEKMAMHLYIRKNSTPYERRSLKATGYAYERPDEAFVRD
jgi:hypothetical protein